MTTNSIANSDSARPVTPPPTERKGSSDFLTPERGPKALVRPLADTPSKVVYPKRRPEWMDGAHRLLRNMAFANREEPVRPSDLESVAKLSQELIERGETSELLMFMKLLSQFYFDGAKGIFFDVLSALREADSDLSLYFRDVETDEPREIPSLTPVAIDALFQFFEGEFGYPCGLLQTAPVTQLPALIDRMMYSPDGTIRGWVVWNDRMEEDPHMVPVFAIQHGGKVHAFIFDSIGHEIGANPLDIKISASLEELIWFFKDSENIQDVLSVYSYGPKRQHSEIGCWAFSILDLKHLLERHIHGKTNLVDFYELQSGAFAPVPIEYFLGDGILFPILEIRTIPPEMIKPTQSLRGIDAYCSSPPSLSEHMTPLFERFTPSWDVWLQGQSVPEVRGHVEKMERVTQQESVRNYYVEQKRLEYIVNLLTYHLKETDYWGSKLPKRSHRILSIDD